MRFLITGITGFAGAHLASLLHEEGHEIIGLVRGSNGMESDILDVISPECFASIRFVYGDLCDRMSMGKAIDASMPINGVFHLAAQSHPPTSFIDPIGTLQVNVIGTANLIEAVTHYAPACKVMVCSTSEVYGNTGRPGGLLREDGQIKPSNPYGASKAAMDLYVQERMENKQLNGFITRAFSHTGPRRGKNFSISADAYQIARIMAGKQEPVLLVGNLETVRVVIDVRDVVRAYYLLMMEKASSGGVFNVCGAIPRPMAFFTDFLIELSGMKIEKVVSPKFYRPIDIAYQAGDVARMESLTGWKPEIPIEKTLADLLDYWCEKIA